MTIVCPPGQDRELGGDRVADVLRAVLLPDKYGRLENGGFVLSPESFQALKRLFSNRWITFDLLKEVDNLANVISETQGLEFEIKT